MGSDVVATAKELCHRECVYVIILGDTFVFLGVITAFRKKDSSATKGDSGGFGERNKTVVMLKILNIRFQPQLTCLDSVVQRL